ncbi:Cocaine esterase [Lecanora helva]
MHLKTWLPILATLHLHIAHALTQGLEVDTSVGRVHGIIDPAQPGVKQWLGIPFAEPPIGSLRFLPPVAFPEGRRNISAQRQPPPCQQYNSKLPSIFNNATPEFLAQPPYSEDCLYLNVIAPRNSTAGKLPVLVWVHGGATLNGGINVSYERPQQWVERSQEHIVVQFKFEWIRKNIEHFGGDSNKLTAWGQSGGASVIDAHQFAFPRDPVFHAAILESADVLQAKADTDPNKTSFSYVAAQLGCSSNCSAVEEVECMRKIDAGVISKFIGVHMDRNATPPLYFQPTADNSLIFTPQQYLTKGNAGDFANLPNILGSNTDEGSSFVPYTEQGPPQAQIDTLGEQLVGCSVATTTQYRVKTGRPTHRYLYGGNFSQISPLPWMGAYHFAEIPLITGTYANYRGPATPFERSVSEKMQDLWLAFADDPQNGLQKQGWGVVSANNSGSAIVFARGGKVAQMEEISVVDAAADADAGCPAS